MGACGSSLEAGCIILSSRFSIRRCIGSSLCRWKRREKSCHWDSRLELVIQAQGACSDGRLFTADK